MAKRSKLVHLIRTERYDLYRRLRDGGSFEAIAKEMAEHRQFTLDTQIAVFFCDPRSPWQPGSNENTNGLLRQYLPKGANFSKVSNAQLQAIAVQLNGRPRKTLDWQTPAEVLQGSRLR